MNITILGCGAYALALSQMFKENNCHITMWSKIKEEVINLKDKYKDITFTNDLNNAIKETNLLVIALPIEYLENTTKELKEYYNNQDILIATKGISQNNNLFSTEIINKYINTPNIGVISGGTFAEDMMNKKIMGLTLATKSNVIINKVMQSLKCKYLDIEISNDLIGVQICGAIKNVMAIACGILNGLNYPESTNSLFLTKAIYEIRDIIISLGGNKDTIISHAGINDITMTCSSTKSRNYTLGKLLATTNKKEIDEYIKNTTIEGLYTAKSIYDLTQEKNLNFPIINIIYNILYQNKDISTLIKYLKQEPY